MDNETRLLILAAEDFTGLWEAALELSDEPASEETARRLLISLVHKDLVELFEDDLRTATPRVLDDDEATMALRPGTQWQVPAAGSTGPLIYFAATEKGVELVGRRNWGEGQSTSV